MTLLLSRLVPDPAGSFRLSSRDWTDLRRRGCSRREVNRQKRLFQKPPSLVLPIDRPCSVGDGIERLSLNQQDSFLGLAAAALENGRFSFFVPASGAATRLFSFLWALRSLKKSTGQSLSVLLRSSGPVVAESRTFFSNLDRLALARPLRRLWCGPRRDWEKFVDKLLVLSGQPKALLPFHGQGARGKVSAFEEHLLELVSWRDRWGRARIHFTVSPEFFSEFERLGKVWVKKLEKRGSVDLRFSLTVQDPATDTLAVDKGGWARRSDGRLLFRPGGHGALLSNLEKTGGDLVFIRNIDNIPISEHQGDGRRWRRVLAGRLIDVQNKSAAFFSKLRRSSASLLNLGEAESFIHTTLGLRPVIGSVAARRAAVRDRLNRPWRVCGMVPNSGEPGGGPFWVGHGAQATRQIVESSQLSSDQQEAFLKRSTHFNPVDLVVGLRNAQGRPFQLSRFSDPDQVLFSKKNFEGREVVTLEHPGLWNGAMARWNTIFVEIPESVFHPVKTIQDLLRPGHGGCSVVTGDSREAKTRVSSKGA